MQASKKRDGQGEVPGDINPVPASVVRRQIAQHPGWSRHQAAGQVQSVSQLHLDLGAGGDTRHGRPGQIALHLRLHHTQDLDATGYLANVSGLGTALQTRQARAGPEIEICLGTEGEFDSALVFFVKLEDDLAH